MLIFIAVVGMPEEFSSRADWAAAAGREGVGNRCTPGDVTHVVGLMKLLLRRLHEVPTMATMEEGRWRRKGKRRMKAAPALPSFHYSDILHYYSVPRGVKDT